MIGLWCRDNGQWLVAMRESAEGQAGLSVVCSPLPARARRFEYAAAAMAFAHREGIERFFEPRPLEPAAVAPSGKGTVRLVR